MSRVERVIIKHLKGIRYLDVYAKDLNEFAGPCGAGKQQPVDTPVLTPDGWKPIGKVCVGDSLVGSDGRPTTVEGVYPQGVKPSYRVFFTDGSSTEAGPDHLWTVAYRGRDWHEIVLSTEQIRTRGVLVRDWDNKYRRETDVDLSRKRLYIPMLSSPVEFSTALKLPIPPYTLGQLIANGYLSGHSASIASNAKDWPEISGRLSLDGCDVGPVRYYGSVARVTVRGVIGIIKELGLGVRSREKSIPRVYMQASVEDRVAMFHGLMDGDGSISKERNRIRYSTTSDALARDMRELVECLGGIASVNTLDRSSEGKGVEFSVRVRPPPGVSPFSVSRKLSRYDPGTYSRPIRIIDRIEYSRDVESVCVKVEADDQLYATEHCILTHNTTILDAMKWAMGGAKTHQKVPIRKGEEEGSVELHTTDYIITKKFREDGKPLITIKGQKGGRFGQREIDPQLSSLTFDPTLFASWDSEQQLKVVKQLAGEEWCAELLRLDGCVADIFEERTAVNREIKRMGEPGKEPAQAFKIDASELLQERAVIQKFNEDQDAKSRAIGEAGQNISALSGQISQMDDAIEEARKRLQGLQDRRTAMEAQRVTAEEDLEKMPKAEEHRSFKIIDEQIAGLTEANEAAARYAEWEKGKQLYDERVAESVELTDRLAEERNKRLAHIATVDLPLENVGMNDDGLWVNDLPFDQLSGGEKIRASTAIAIAMNPDLRVMFIQHGEQLDDKMFQEVLDMAFAAEPPFQVWVATTDKTGEGHGDAIHIELGEVKEKADAAGGAGK